MTHRFCEVSTVTLFVGKGKKPFYVHQEQLCEVSSFFKAAFTSEFRESSEKTMDLVEEDEDTFDRFVQWLYGQQYDVPLGNGLEGDRFAEPLRLFVLAEKFDVSKLKSLLMVKIFAAGKQGGVAPQCASLIYAYNNTHSGSVIRRLLADWYAFRFPQAWYRGESVQKWFRKHPDFMMDVMLSSVLYSSRQHQYNPFAGTMPEDYKDKESKQEK